MSIPEARPVPPSAGTAPEAAAEGAARPLPFVLGVVGDSGSGKSTVAAGVRALVGPDRVTSLELDDYHRHTRAERAEMGVTALNPAVHNFELMEEHLRLLRRGRPIRNRSYDHSDGSFGPIRTHEAREVVLVRGLLGFPNDSLRSAYDLAVFLHPEAELLIRWKLRRDVRSRGYAGADVLKHIAHHLLDAKEYVHPQSERADLVVRQELPGPEADDSEVRTTLILRRDAADVVRTYGVAERFRETVTVEEGPAEGELTLRLGTGPSMERVEAWARERFPDTFRPGALGGYEGEDAEVPPSASLAFVQVLIARLARVMKRHEDPENGETVRAVEAL